MFANSASAPRFALISVSDKSGLAGFAAALSELGFALLSTGGTAAALRQAGLGVREVSEHTGFPEIMDGRVKTLHPKIHGGILGRDRDAKALQEHGIDPIELVVVNLYPFERVVSEPDCSLEVAMENIDIGGPAMVRAAAKNHARVCVVTRPQDYAPVLAELRQTGQVGATTRARLAARAFAHTARYDALIANYIAGESGALPWLHIPHFERQQALRYGENPHQAAAFYAIAGQDDGGQMESLQGQELSFNNLADADAALECVQQFNGTPACIIVKHANPCGGACAETALEAYRRAHATDPTSAFGGVIAFNAEVDAETAEELLATQFVEVLAAPAYSEDALGVLARKPRLRVLRCPAVTTVQPRLAYHRVAAGMLIQQHDLPGTAMPESRQVSRRAPSPAERADLAFAWKLARLVKSNAIVYAKDLRALGIGAGQMSRIDSARIAAWKAADAGVSLAGSVMASDAFFPFRDSIDTAARAGVRAVIQPGGSKRDAEVIAAADEHDIAMLFTGVRHFRH